MKRLVFNFVIVIVVMGLLITGCTANGFSGVSHGSFTNPKSDTKVVERIIKDHHEKLVMDLSIEAEKGKIMLIILKPNGEEFINKAIIGKDNYNEKITIKKPLPGTWIIKTVMEDAVGKYRYEISGK